MASSKENVCNETLQYNEAASPIINGICEPLFRYSGLRTFTYMRFEKDRFFHSSNNLPLANYYTTNNFYQKHLERYAVEISQIPIGSFGFFFRKHDVGADSLSKNIVDTLAHFNVAHGLSFYWRGTNNIEGFHFGTISENELILNFYLNHMDLLKKFANYFKEKAFEHITPIKPHFSVIPDSSVFCKIEELERKNGSMHSSPQDLWPAISTNGSGTQHLSRREIECLAILAHGKKVKEIAQYLLIAPRAVETHLNFAKLKLGLNTSQLIDYYWRSNLSWTYPVKWEINNEK